MIERQLLGERFRPLRLHDQAEYLPALSDKLDKLGAQGRRKCTIGARFEPFDLRSKISHRDDP